MATNTQFKTKTGKPPYKTCYGTRLADDWASKLAQEAIDEDQIKTPDVLDGSKACNEYLEKQSKNTLVNFLMYVANLIRRK